LSGTQAAEFVTVPTLMVALPVLPADTVVRNTPFRSAIPMKTSTPVCTSVSDCVLLMRICRVVWSP
jgi:hypothetical protein